MTTNSDGDVHLFHTLNDGEISIVGGFVQLSGAIDSAVYLSLFGGNDDDDGSANNRRQFWGNLLETDPAYQYRSRTQYALRSLPAIPDNMRKVEDAVRADLAWMLTTKAATAVDVSVTMPGINRVRLAVTITADDRVSTITFAANWKAQ